MLSGSTAASWRCGHRSTESRPIVRCVRHVGRRVAVDRELIGTVVRGSYRRRAPDAYSGTVAVGVVRVTGCRPRKCRRRQFRRMIVRRTRAVRQGRHVGTRVLRVRLGTARAGRVLRELTLRVVGVRRGRQRTRRRVRLARYRAVGLVGVGELLQGRSIAERYRRRGVVRRVRGGHRVAGRSETQRRWQSVGGVGDVRGVAIEVRNR